MPQPLLKTKLHVPNPRPELVPRPRLLERLTQGLPCPLAVISAPAGSGKTTLVGEWRVSPAGKALPLAWLSLDADDNDLARFVTFLIAAIETLQAGLGAGAQALLQASSTLAVKPILTALLNALSDLSADAVLVLDDYHVITSTAIHEAIVYLLDHLPPPMHLIIISRIDPPLPLARLRARCQLTEIRTADLRFSSDEAAAFLNQTMRLNLAADDIAALEGWSIEPER